MCGKFIFGPVLRCFVEKFDQEKLAFSCYVDMEKMPVAEMGGWLPIVMLLLDSATNLQWQEKSRHIFGTKKTKTGKVRFALLRC